MTRSLHRLEIFLQPGEYFVGDADYRIRTLLGSCVSITLWHPGQKVGAMSHTLLASRPRVDGRPDDSRYGDEAMRLMLRELRKAGVDPRECDAKVFGGGDMFPGHRRGDGINVGRRNGEAALDELRRQGIRIVSESLYGAGHRQVIFDIGNGHVWSRQVRPSEAAGAFAGLSALPPAPPAVAGPAPAPHSDRAHTHRASRPRIA